MKALYSINWRYTFGEIIIVIIGITIAFSLNNWAASVKQSQDRKLYIENLRLDLENDSLHLSQNIELLRKRLIVLGSLMPHLGRALPGRDTMSKSFFELADLVEFSPKDITYQTLINTGDFNIIGDFELKSEIEAHYDTYESLQKAYKRREHINEKYLADFFVYELDYDKIRQGNNDFLDNKQIKNILFSLFGTFNIQIKASEEGIKSCIHLLKALEKTKP